MRALVPTIEAELESLQRESFSYFEHEVNPANGLVNDKTAESWPASIAATGFALAAYPIGVERGFITRAAAVERTLTTLRFFRLAGKDRNPRQPGIRASIIIFSIHKPGGVLGPASFQP